MLLLVLNSIKKHKDHFNIFHYVKFLSSNTFSYILLCNDNLEWPTCD